MVFNKDPELRKALHSIEKGLKDDTQAIIEFIFHLNHLLVKDHETNVCFDIMMYYDENW